MPRPLPFALTLVLATTFSAAWAAGQGQAADPKDRHTGEGRVYSAEAGMSMVVPKGWVQKDQGNPKPLFTFVGPAAEGAPNVNLRKVAGQGELPPVEQLADAVKKQLAGQFKDWELVEEGAITIDGKKAYTLTSKFSVEANGQTIKLQNVQYYIPSAKAAYIVTFTALAAKFADHKATFAKAAQSIRVD
jgi:hypothetical protein